MIQITERVLPAPLGKLVDSKLAQLFFKPIFMGKSAHAIPLTLTSATDEGKNVRVLMPEELERAWRNADGKNAGIKVANAILDLASTLPDADTSTISNLLSQFKHRANALIRAEIEAREGRKEVEKDTQVSMMMKGAAHNTSIHARALYNILLESSLSMKCTMRLLPVSTFQRYL